MKERIFTAKTKKGQEIPVLVKNAPDRLICEYEIMVILNEKKYQAVAICLNKSQAKIVLGVDLPPNAKATICLAISVEEWREFEKECIHERIEVRNARLEALFPGLIRLRDARIAQERYDNAFAAAMDRGSCVFPSPIKMGERYEDLAPQYPAAVAYLRAESYSMASHVEKASAGQTAMRRMENGEDAVRVALEMEEQWHHAAEVAVWNN